MQNPSDLDGQPLELLIKIMGMTTSDNDPTVLAAIRRANNQLLKMNASWEAILRGKVKIVADPFSNINIPKGMDPNNNQTFNPKKAPPPPEPPEPPPTYSKPWPQPSPSATQAYAASRAAQQAQASARAQSPTPKPGSPSFAGDVLKRTIVNKFEGVCSKCQNKVLIGEGVAQQYERGSGKTYWITEHAVGGCGPARTSGPASTVGSFQV